MKPTARIEYRDDHRPVAASSVIGGPIELRTAPTPVAQRLFPVLVGLIVAATIPLAIIGLAVIS